MKKVTTLLLFFVMLSGCLQSAISYSEIGGGGTGGTTVPPKGGGPTIVQFEA